VHGVARSASLAMLTRFLQFDPEWNVYNFGQNTSMRLVIENLIPLAHPMHLHGHNVFVAAEGTGTWDGTIVNPSGPTRRDVQLLRSSGYMVFQIDADNTGVWPFHCHIAWHVSGGLYVNILERPDLITSLKISEAITDTCVSWDAYTNS
jgi:FtsP/CotA-like multicopper oxidase with cupredoxin domain